MSSLYFKKSILEGHLTYEYCINTTVYKHSVYITNYIYYCINTLYLI